MEDNTNSQLVKCGDIQTIGATSLSGTLLTSEKIEEINLRAKEWALLHGVQLGILNKLDSNSSVSFVPFTLFPTPVQFSVMKEAKLLQKTYNRLIHQVAYDHEYLTESLKSVIEVDEFTNMLWNIYSTVRKEGNPQPVSLGLFRNDYMLNMKTGERNGDSQYQDLCFKQIEFNTISVAHAGVSSGIWKVHRYTMKLAGLEYTKETMPANLPGIGLAKGLIKAWNFYKESRAAIVMVVSKATDSNYIDQRWIEKSVFELNRNITFIYTSLYYSAKWRLTDRKTLFIDGYEIAVVYFRDGYSPDHYPTHVEKEGRLMVERSRAIKCPSVQYQLAGCKKIQQTLTVPGALERFIKDPIVLQRIRKTFAAQYSLEKEGGRDGAISLALSNPETYVLKPQREGGGNNVFGNDIVRVLTAVKTTKEYNSYILMERLFPLTNKNYIITPGHSRPLILDVVSELGIYGTYMGSGEEELLNEEAGYFLKTRPVETNEASIRKETAGLDSVILKES